MMFIHFDSAEVCVESKENGTAEMKPENEKTRMLGGVISLGFDTDHQDEDLKKIQGRFSPIFILLITLLGIAVAEVIAMIVVYFYRDLPYYQQVLIDAAVMSVIIFPILYYLSFRPILQHIERRYQVEKEILQREQKEKELLQTIYSMQLDIARDLHDTIGQNIGYLRMRLDYLAEKEMPETKEAMQAEFLQMSRVATESYDLVRGTLAILQSQGPGDLLQLFKRYAGQVMERSAVEIQFGHQGEAEALSHRQMRQLFYIFREALNNIEKHAAASQARVDMHWNEAGLTMFIQDNGRGFNPETPPPGGHYGLKFMRERAEMMNGSCAIRSQPGDGTTVTIHVPVERKSPAF